MKHFKTHVGKTYIFVLKNYPIVKTLKNSCWKNIQKCLKKLPNNETLKNSCWKNIHICLKKKRAPNQELYSSSRLANNSTFKLELFKEKRATQK